MNPHISKMITAPTMAPMKPALLTSMIPAESLSEVGRDQGTDNAESCSENEALGLFLAGRYKLGNHSGNEADNDSPDSAEHVVIPPRNYCGQLIIDTAAFGGYPSQRFLGFLLLFGHSASIERVLHFRFAR